MKIRPPHGSPSPDPVRWIAVAAMLALGLAPACAGSKGTVYTPEEIAAAEQGDNLEALFEAAAASLQDMKPDSKAAAETRATMQAVGSRLSEGVEREVRANLEAARLESGLIPRDALTRERARIAKLQRWDPERFTALDEFFAMELAQTENAIAKNRAALGGLTDDQAVERLRILETLGELAGTGSEEQSKYVDQRLAIIEQMRVRATDALEEENLEEAQRVLMILKEAEPQNVSVEEQLVEVDEAVFERDFWTALEQGDPDGAYGAFSTLASSSSFAAVKPALEGSADKMSSYFGALAAGATQEGNFDDAYRWFLQAREIKTSLGQKVDSMGPEERTFVEAMQASYMKARKADRPGLAWAYLSVIEDLSPMTPSLRRQIRETREQVETAAVRRLTAFPFSEDNGQAGDFGEAVGAKVIQYLFEAIPQDVRIIEREQLSDILREREMAGTSQAEAAQLASADYLVQGSILEAKVDTVDKLGRKTLRVITEHREETNPRHASWLAMAEDMRAKTPEPPPTVIREIKEDVKFDVTIHRKVGIFSSSYRLIDAQSAKVIFADSVRRKVEHQDESNEGIELGEFSMPFKLAELPSDTEILTQLADEVSLEIGKRIAEVLRDPEEKYRATAQRFASEGNFAGASEQAAYAVVLLERKDKDAADLRKSLREYAVAASPAL
ncbi:MAG: CsgG/HfaB family protein [Myxococcota bacterium]